MPRTFFQKIKDNIEIILIIAIIIAAIFVGIDYFYDDPFSRTETKILVSQNVKDRSALEVFRENEKLALLFSEAIDTSSFSEKVFDSDSEIAKSYFGEDDAEIQKEWKEKVKVLESEDLPLIHIAIYHKNKDQAKRIGNAVAQVLQTQSEYYTGNIFQNLSLGSEDKNLPRFEIKVIDEPFVKSYFSVWERGAAGFVGGSILGIILVSIFTFLSERRRTKFLREVAGNMKRINKEKGVGFEVGEEKKGIKVKRAFPEEAVEEKPYFDFEKEKRREKRGEEKKVLSKEAEEKKSYFDLTKEKRELEKELEKKKILRGASKQKAEEFVKKEKPERETFKSVGEIIKENRVFLDYRGGKEEKFEEKEEFPKSKVLFQDDKNENSLEPSFKKSGVRVGEKTYG